MVYHFIGLIISFSFWNSAGKFEVCFEFNISAPIYIYTPPYLHWVEIIHIFLLLPPCHTPMPHKRVNHPKPPLHTPPFSFSSFLNFFSYSSPGFFRLLHHLRVEIDIEYLSYHANHSNHLLDLMQIFLTKFRL